MANILDLITIGEKKYLVVDADPAAGGGTSAEVASVAVWETGTNVGKMFLKIGPLDTDWDQVSTTSASGVLQGDYLRLPIYNTNASGYSVDDVVLQNSQAIDVAIQPQPTRSAAIEYRIPNPGDAISTADFILSEGAQTKNGNMTFNNNVIVQGDLTVNGALTFLNSTQTQIKDKLITLNQGGGAASGGGSGFEVAESVQATSTSAGANAGSIFTANATGAAGNGIVVTVTDSGGPGAVTVVEGVGTVAIELNGNGPVSQATLASAGMTLVTLNGVGLVAAEVFPATSGGTGTVTGYFKMSADRTGYDILPSASSFAEKLSSANLTAARTAKFADTSGTFVMRPDGTPGVASQVAYYSDANNIVSAAGFTYAAGVLTSQNMTISSLGLGIAHVSAAGVISSSAIALASGDVTGVLPLANGGTSANLTASAGSVVYSTASAMAMSAVGTAGQALLSGGVGAPTWFTGTGVVHATSGVLSASNVVLTSEVTGILPIANGGTNSATALNNDRIMISSAGAIVEHSAMVPNQVYFGAATTGLPAQSANLFWDITNSRLGIGTITPSRSLDVAGSSLFEGALKLAVSAAPLANFEMLQAQVLTTDATVTPIASVAIPTNSVVMIKAKIVGRRTGGTAGAAQDSAAYERTAKFKNIAGVVTIANLQSDYTSEDQAAFNGTMVVNGTNAEIQVKGAANNNMSWTVTYEVISL